METNALARDNCLSDTIGANITFHRIVWEGSQQPSIVTAGGGIVYHSLPTEPIKLHSHEFAELFLILNGKINHIVNSTVQELGTGGLVFVRPSDVHGFEACKSTSSTPCELVILSFQLETMLLLSKYLGNDTFLRNYTGPVTAPQFKLSVSETEELSAELMQLWALQSKNQDMAKLKIKIFLANILTRYFLGNRLDCDHSAPEWLPKLCQAMHQVNNFSHGMTAMKKLAPCTQEHLCKVFRKHIGKSPTEYINDIRMNYAAKMIVETDDKIYSIAMDVGCNSLSRFYMLFKKHYRVSPAQYRAIAQKNYTPV